MRQDQFERLQALTEKLTDVFLTEADPDKWPGNGVEPLSWDQQTRGDRYWSKKNAAATLTVIMKTAHFVGTIQQNSSRGAGAAAVPEHDDAPDTLDAEIAAAEKEAAKLMDQALNRVRTGVFGKKAHGKP